MANVDNRVVSMKFDNKDFEKNVSGTRRTLDKLKEALLFKGGKKGLEDVSKAAGNVKFDGMASGIETVKAKFGALQTIGIAALASLTSKAVDSGLRIAKALTLDNVIDGFKEYEQNINSIQTILANTESKGGTLEGVNAALDELNAYADQTIYNFSEMTRNIGTFTAAGVGLDQSVRSIKGIANIAAVSGSNSQQASTAMYQLSQAIAAGSVKLQDWNSVVNAGMGGEVLQSALFETGKALGTLTDVPVEKSFQEWKDEGNSFRETLQDGWITTDVLTTTLEGFTGELSDAELAAKGFNEQQIASIQKMAATATAAATEVKTATQLISVVQEAIGSGWASTFRIVIGDFEQAKTLFSGLSAIITTPLGEMAAARNEVLQGWSNLGGRQAIIEGLFHALRSLLDVLRPIGEAFREVFPKKTTSQLLAASVSFRAFFRDLKIGEGTISAITFVFKTLFQAVKVGFEVFKGVARVFGAVISVGAKLVATLVGVFAELTGGGINSVYSFLTAGKGIENFFDVLVSVIQTAGDFLIASVGKMGDAILAIADFFAPVIDKAKEFKDFVFGLFEGGEGDGGPSFLTSSLEKLRDVFNQVTKAGEPVADVFRAIWDVITSLGAVVREAAGSVLSFIGDFFSSLGAGVDDAAKGALAALGGGALAGLAAALTRFAKDGFKFDFGQFDFLDNISDVVEEFTGVLGAMQTQIKANAIKQIAIAVGILAASMLVLSFLDGKQIAQTLGGVAGAMATLTTALFGISKIDGSGLSLGTLATSLIVLSGAILVLSVAMRVMSGMDWSDMLKGLTGIAAALGLLILASKGLEKANGSFIRAGVGLVVIAGALFVFAAAISRFAEFAWAEIVSGLVGIGLALGLFVLAVNYMDPKAAFSLGAGMVLFSFALDKIAGVISEFADFSWNEMLKGFLGLFITLELLAFYTNQLQQNDIIKVAIGLLLLSGALYVIQSVISKLGQLSIAELITGLIAMAAALAVVVVASNAMNGAIAGAAAIIIMAGALYIMGEVLARIGELGLGTILVGLLGLAGVLVILGLAALALVAFPPLGVALQVMGVALLAIGAGFALLGVGAYLAAEALSKMGEVSGKAVDKLFEIMDRLVESVPRWARTFAEGLGEFVIGVIEMGPQILDAFNSLFDAIINFIIEKTPAISEMFGVLLQAGLDLMREKVPEFIDLAFFLLTSFGNALAENIPTLVDIAYDIMEGFLQGIADNVGRVIDAAVSIIVNFIGGIGQNINRIIDAGVGLITDFLKGVADGITGVAAAVTEVINAFITAVGDSATSIAQAGTDALTNFLGGITDNIAEVGNAVRLLIFQFFLELMGLTDVIIDGGTNVLINFLKGIAENTDRITQAVGAVILSFFSAVDNLTQLIINKGTDVIVNFLHGLTKSTFKIMNAATTLITTFIRGLSSNSLRIIRAAGDALLDFLNGIAFYIEYYAPRFRRAARRIATALIDGLTGGLASKAGEVFGSLKDVATGAIDRVKGFFGINSPSKVFAVIGGELMEGLAYGLDNDNQAEESLNRKARSASAAFQKAMERAAFDISNLSDVNPTIKPVLDLEQVKKEAGTLGKLLDTNRVQASLSLENASVISAATLSTGEANEGIGGGETVINFEQNNYSPEALSTADIYRQTKGQIALAKERLSL